MTSDFKWTDISGVKNRFDKEEVSLPSVEHMDAGFSESSRLDNNKWSKGFIKIEIHLVKLRFIFSVIPFSITLLFCSFDVLRKFRITRSCCCCAR